MAEESSAQRPIVLLHGCGGSPEAAFERTGWLDAAAAHGRTAVAPRLPGHGTGSSHDPADYGDLAGALLPQLPTGKFDAIGFSLGGKIVLELALRVPERIGRIVLGGVGDNVFAPEAVGEAAARALLDGEAPDTPPPVRAFLKTWEPGVNEARAIAAVLRRPPNPVFTEAGLARVTQQVLIVNGADDPIGAIGDRLVHSLPAACGMTLPSAGHFDLTAQPAFIEAALDFLGEGALEEKGRA